jgi:hypothetical protein
LYPQCPCLSLQSQTLRFLSCIHELRVNQTSPRRRFPHIIQLDHTYCDDRRKDNNWHLKGIITSTREYARRQVANTENRSDADNRERLI